MFRNLVVIATMVCALLCAQSPIASTREKAATGGRSTAQLRAWVESSPKLPLDRQELTVNLAAGQEINNISWISRDPKSGIIWLFQRGDKADPVIAINPDGRVLRSFGKGMFEIPHAIRIGPDGNVWTVDAKTSRVVQFSPSGQKLLQIAVGGQPERPSPFRGTTDIGFSSGGRIFISDGYGNARILEFTSAGRRVRDWGTPGTGPGQFNLPHSVLVDQDNILWVADRENGRIQKFDLEGRFVGEIQTFGRTYSLAPGPKGTLWTTVSPLDQPPGSPGWIIQLDRSGKLLGQIPVADRPSHHTIADMGDGQPATIVGNKVIWFRHR